METRTLVYIDVALITGPDLFIDLVNEKSEEGLEVFEFKFLARALLDLVVEAVEETGELGLHYLAQLEVAVYAFLVNLSTALTAVHVLLPKQVLRILRDITKVFLLLSLYTLHLKLVIIRSC